MAGLATGCYARLNGYDTLLLEQHERPGGVCASWRRGDYIFDYCLHHLAGTDPASPLHDVWQTLGALDDTPILNAESLVRIEGPEGQALELYRDLDRLQAQIEAMALQDRAAIRRYVDAARSLVGADIFSMGLAGPREMLRLATRLPTIIGSGRTSLKKLTEQFTEPFVRRALPHAQYNITGPEMPMLPNVMFLGALQRGDLGWPYGGSGAMAQRIADRYGELGGEIAYGAPVREILVEGDRARGVRMDDGTEHRADLVVSAADGHTTVYRMLAGRYTSPIIDDYYCFEAYPQEQAFGLTIYLGVNMDLAQEPRHLTLLYDEPLELWGGQRDSLYVETMAEDTGLAAPGKTVVKAVTTGAYDPWNELRTDDLDAYRAAKAEVAQAVAQRLDQRWPGLADHVEMHDVVTPVTVERYTGSFHGFQPWSAPSAGMRVMMQGLTRTLPGLEGFYHVGQWADAMIGLSNAAMSGRSLIRRLCRQERRRFVE